MRIRNYNYWIFLAFTLLLYNCDWDPPHDNPFDPDNPNYSSLGSLRLKVYPLDWHDAPLPGVTVLIPELERFGITDENGEKLFEQIPADTLLVVAYRDLESEVIYARDSIEVIIKPSHTTFDSLRLDAVPFFDSTRVNSITVAEENQGEDTTRTFARLTAWVRDPDGGVDLVKVEFRFLNMIHDSLDYVPDSAYWRIDVPSGAFPDGDLSNTLLLPFEFEVFDRAQNSSRDIATLARVINTVPILRTSGNIPSTPRLEWNYSLSHQLPNTRSFHYLVRIYTADADQTVVVDTLTTPSEFTLNWIDIEEPLPPRPYFWQVWVIDNFGNMSRSLPAGIQVYVSN